MCSRIDFLLYLIAISLSFHGFEIHWYLKCMTLLVEKMCYRFINVIINVINVWCGGTSNDFIHHGYLCCFNYFQNTILVRTTPIDEIIEKKFVYLWTFSANSKYARRKSLNWVCGLFWIRPWFKFISNSNVFKVASYPYCKHVARNCICQYDKVTNEPVFKFRTLRVT